MHNEKEKINSKKRKLQRRTKRRINLNTSDENEIENLNLRFSSYKIVKI